MERKYGFCDYVGCDHFYPTNRFEKEVCNASWNSTCIYSIRIYLEWLKNNGLVVVPIKKGE